MTTECSKDLESYNRFCRNLREGCILYNVDTTNSWGEYLLVVNIATLKFNDQKTYTVLLLGLDRKESNFVPRNLRIKFTPDYAGNIPFLKYVGRCNFTLKPELSDINVNLGLASIYSSVNLKNFARHLSVRKPKTRKYGKDGKLVIKRLQNE